jgi:hypothetical protein
MGDRECSFGYVCLLEIVSYVAYGRDWVYLCWVDMKPNGYCYVIL